ncbi:serine/threonine-protein kinase ULK4-like isoform X1 [Nothobranchius furzeri]|uniref:serine/threonine-protein kinase ULK4-like isoform X1 n=1 Tax=Nothobranchius furzeri TaxID=105023 RepID=UPI0039049840
MENFILYEKLGTGRTSVVYKGRRKGHLSYVAIICTDKSKRPLVTNHVRLSQDLEHPHITHFYEWYETSNHLWLVAELCTGGSLEFVIARDGSLPEGVVRSFGWGLVKGLKHIHELGVILSDLTPAKILLDGSGILKFSNFYLSKAEGERLEDIFKLLSTSEEAGERRENFDHLRKKLQGCPTYSAPEVLQGSETSVRSDLWALGCILYYMCAGKPPFSSDSLTDLTEMILHQEPPPLRQTGQDFQSLLKGLLNKDPDKRLNWPELLHHPFWAQIKKAEEDDAKGDEHIDKGGENGCKGGDSNLRSKNTPGLFRPGQTDNTSSSQPGYGKSNKISSSNVTNTRSCDPETDGLQAKHVMSEASKQDRVPQKEAGKERTENVFRLKPKSGEDQDNTELIFLLSCSLSDSLEQSSAPETNAGADVTKCVKRLLHTDSDLNVTPIVDNPKILKSPPVRFDSKTLCVPAYSVEKLLSLSDDEWTAFILQLHSCFEEQKSSVSLLPSNVPAQSTAVRSRLNLLCYLCCVAGNTVVANRLMNSSLLVALTQQLRQAPNWDVRSKVLRLMGLLALHCDLLEEDSSVSEAVSTMTDLLRENLRNSKLKQFVLPPLGEFLYLISSQEEKRGSPEGLWFIPTTAYTGLMRSLREGDDAVSHHMAVKTIENIFATDSGLSQHLATTEMGSALWYLFTHSTVEAVRVTAISALSRLTRLDPAVFLSVMDTCGPAAILEGIGGAGARVQQHLLTAVASALLTSHIQTNRITQSRDLVLKVLRCLESPSTLTRAKALLLLLLLMQNNTHTLLYCCQHRLVMYLERDLRKATPLRENPSQSGYLGQCLDLLLGHLSATAPVIMEDVLNALGGVIGRRHPSAAQSKQLKQTLPTVSVVLGLLSSQVFRPRIVHEEFLVQIGLVLKYVTSIESHETNLASAVGASIREDLIRTTLSIVEVLSQHHTLITQYHVTVVDAILPPLTTLAFSKNVEWSVFVLKVLSELSLILLVQDEDIQENFEKTENRDRKGEDGKSLSQISALYTKSLLPRFESLLTGPEPVPLYALKLLVSMTEHSSQICRLIKCSRILPVVFQLIVTNNISSGVVQHAVVLLCNLCEDIVLDQHLYQKGLVEVVVTSLSQAAPVYLGGEKQAGRKVSHLVLQAFLELLHNILKQISAAVQAALQSQRLSCPPAETEAAEKLLVANRPLSQLSTHLIHMLSGENQDVWEESLQCLSLLVQLYAGEGQDCLSPSCLQSFSHILRTNASTKSLQTQSTTLRIIKRLIQTTERSDWLECPEGAGLRTLLQDIATSNRCHADVTSLAAEVLGEISFLKHPSSSQPEKLQPL